MTAHVIHDEVIAKVDGDAVMAELTKRERAAATIIDTMEDASLFGRWFSSPSWRPWFVFLRALFGLKIRTSDVEIYRRHTERSATPKAQAREAWMAVGRRGGKSRIAALVATYLACFRSYAAYLAPGEVATIAIIAADRRQARTIMRYVSGFLENSTVATIRSRKTESIELANRVAIEVHTASFRAVRGYTLAAVICDEIAFWRSEESANPAEEILVGLRPGMATIPDALLLCLSSPYSRRGPLWEAYKTHFGRDGDPVLVWQADTASMNPSVDPEIIRQAYEEDPQVAAAEYGGEFRSDLEGFIGADALADVTVEGQRELPPRPGLSYVAFVDPSGGSQDSMTLAIAHQEKGVAVLDLLTEVKPPFSPDGVTKEFAATLARYGVTTVVGDRYGGEWPRERFRVHGVDYQLSAQTKSEIYGAFLPMVNARRCELLENARLATQLASLERRTGRSGKDSIDHPPGAHDDVANAAAGAVVLAGNVVDVSTLTAAGDDPFALGVRESPWSSMR